MHHTGRAAEGLASAGIEIEAALCRELQRRHRAREFIDLGYHFVVMPSGRVFAGRPVNAMGAHVLGSNTGTVAVCLAGNFDVEQPTKAALGALDAVCADHVPGAAAVPVLGHCDFAPKRCPGRAIQAHLQQRTLSHA